ncbi:MAG TPA: hypothetical protein VFU76_10865 [Terriglobales bacterium]|nr:hypothetical protein [Terriglobales bacterium]
MTVRATSREVQRPAGEGACSYVIRMRLRNSALRPQAGIRIQ